MYPKRNPIKTTLGDSIEARIGKQAAIHMPRDRTLAKIPPRFTRQWTDGMDPGFLRTWHRHLVGQGRMPSYKEPVRRAGRPGRLGRRRSWSAPRSKPDATPRPSPHPNWNTPTTPRLQPGAANSTVRLPNFSHVRGRKGRRAIRRAKRTSIIELQPALSPVTEVDSPVVNSHVKFAEDLIQAATRTPKSSGPNGRGGPPYLSPVLGKWRGGTRSPGRGSPHSSSVGLGIEQGPRVLTQVSPPQTPPRTPGVRVPSPPRETPRDETNALYVRLYPLRNGKEMDTDGVWPQSLWGFRGPFYHSPIPPRYTPPVEQQTEGVQQSHVDSQQPYYPDLSQHQNAWMEVLDEQQTVGFRPSDFQQPYYPDLSQHQNTGLGVLPDEQQTVGFQPSDVQQPYYPDLSQHQQAAAAGVLPTYLDQLFIPNDLGLQNQDVSRPPDDVAYPVLQGQDTSHPLDEVVYPDLHVQDMSRSRDDVVYPVLPSPNAPLGLPTPSPSPERVTRSRQPTVEDESNDDADNNKNHARSNPPPPLVLKKESNYDANSTGPKQPRPPSPPSKGEFQELMLQAYHTARHPYIPLLPHNALSSPFVPSSPPPSLAPTTPFNLKHNPDLNPYPANTMAASLRTIKNTYEWRQTISLALADFLKSYYRLVSQFAKHNPEGVNAVSARYQPTPAAPPSSSFLSHFFPETTPNGNHNHHHNHNEAQAQAQAPTTETPLSRPRFPCSSPHPEHETLHLPSGERFFVMRAMQCLISEFCIRERQIRAAARRRWGSHETVSRLSRMLGRPLSKTQEEMETELENPLPSAVVDLILLTAVERRVSSGARGVAGDERFFEELTREMGLTMEDVKAVVRMVTASAVGRLAFTILYHTCGGGGGGGGDKDRGDGDGELVRMVEWNEVWVLADGVADFAIRVWGEGA